MDGIQPMIGYDSAQILRFTSTGITEEVCRIGYSPHSATALLEVFPQLYPPGFSSRANPRDPHLPASVSTSEPDFLATFVDTPIWRDNLERDGYRDGMSLELYLRGKPVGLAHFSSRYRDFFTDQRKEAAFSLSGLLAHFAASQVREITHDVHTAEVTGWRTTVFTEGRTPPLETSPDITSSSQFREHLKNLPVNGEPVRHLWRNGKTLYEVKIDGGPQDRSLRVSSRPTPNRKYFDATIQELQVLSCLCCGLSNGEIASRLHISPRTVHSHMESLRRKTSAANRVELAVVALSTGTFIPDPEWAPINEILRELPAQ